MAFKPLFFKDYKLTIGADVSAECSAVTLTPKPTVHTFKGGGATPADYKDLEMDWSLDVTYAQDWATATSLGRYLLAHIGETITGVEFEPKAAAGPKFTVSILITPGSAGGTGRGHAVSTVSLEVVGQPVFATGA
jgi:hypothetical protein